MKNDDGSALTERDEEAIKNVEIEDDDDDKRYEKNDDEEDENDEEEAKQHALRLLEEEEDGQDAEEETSKAKAKRNQVLEQFEDERESAKFDVDERTSFGGKHPKEIPTIGANFGKGNNAKDPRLSKEASQLRKLCKQGTKALLLPTHELLMSAATRTFVMDRKDDDDVVDGALDEDKSGEKFQRPRKEYENENERDEALEEELRNVQKGLLSKLYDGDKKEEERIGATKKRRKSVDFDLKEEEENDDARSDGERSDISWGAKMGTYEDPAKRSRAVSSSAAARKADDDGDEYGDRKGDEGEDEEEDLERDKVRRGRKRTNRDGGGGDDDDDDDRRRDSEEKMKEEARKRQRALEEEEAERQRQRQILLEKEEEENKRVKHIEFMKHLHKNPTAGEWWLPNEEDGKPTLGPFQWAELSVNLPGVRVAHRYEDNRWQFVGNVNENENLVPFVPYSSSAAATTAAADNPPELAIAKKMERENVFLPRKQKPLEDDTDEEEEEEEEEKVSSDDEVDDGDDGVEKESSEEGLVVEDGEVYDDDGEEGEDDDNDDDDDDNENENLSLIHI